MQLREQGLVLGAAEVVSGDEVEGVALRSELCFVPGFSLVDGEVRFSLSRVGV